MNVKPPSAILTLTEGLRTVFDAALLPFSWPMLWKLPAGDGHPVMVLPGFLGSSGSTASLRSFLSSKGYDVHDWGLGRNLGQAVIGETGERLIDKVDGIVQSGGRKASLVGWSLGGVMAREIAKARPELVRQVITLGSPFNNGPTASIGLILELYKAVSGHATLDDAFIDSLRVPPPVPTTAIYTKGDGIVSWESCVERESKLTDNIEVTAAHCGLGFNSEVYAIIARKLTMAEDAWKKF